jgi:hypothetical protein
MKKRIPFSVPASSLTPLEQAEHDVACEEGLITAITTGKSTPFADAAYLAEFAQQQGYALSAVLPSARQKLAVAQERVAALRAEVRS